jgi:hypothetical protein
MMAATKMPMSNPKAIFFLTNAISKPKPNPTKSAKTGDRPLLF